MIEANVDRFGAAQNFFGCDDVFGPGFARDIGQRQHEDHRWVFTGPVPAPHDVRDEDSFLSLRTSAVEPAAHALFPHRATMPTTKRLFLAVPA